MSELKRCPFCGGELGFRTWIAFDGESYSLKCSTKDCLFNISSFKNKKDLIKKANTRKPMERIVERLEEYRDDFMNDVYEELREDADNCRANRIIDRFDEVTEILKEEGGLNE